MNRATLRLDKSAAARATVAKLPSDPKQEVEIKKINLMQKYLKEQKVHD